MNKFDNILTKYFVKEEINLTGSGAKAVTSPQFQQVIGNAVKQAGPQGDAIKALGASLMGDPHFQDFNKLLDPKNSEFKNVGDFLQKHQDLAPRFAELGLVQPAKPETTKEPEKTPTTTPVPAESTTTATPQAPAYSTGAPVGA